MKSPKELKQKTKIMNEKLIERKLRLGVESRGGQAIKLAAFSFTGMPDRLVLLPGGKVWFVETKSTGKKMSTRQVAVKGLLERLGFEVWVIDDQISLDKFLAHVEK